MSDPIAHLPEKGGHEVPAVRADTEKGEVVVGPGADLGLQFLAHHGVVEYTAEEERRVRWKIDLFVLPILMITFGLQYLDKVAMSYSAVYNMRQDLGMKGQQYSWATSLFYFGYLVGEIPANILLQKLPVGKFSAVTLFIWGAIVMLCAATKNFAGMATLRFLMGFFEAGIPPAWIQITSMFYKGQEQGTRCTAWYTMVGVAAIVGGLLSYGVGHINTTVQKWQFIFLLCGGLSIFWSIVVFLFLPDSPTNAKFLSDREKLIAIERVRENRTGIKNTQFKVHQALEALRDPQVWVFALYNGIAMIVNIGGSFLPIIIEDLGFTGIETTLLTLPFGGIECVAMAVAGGLSWYFTNARTVIILVVTLPSLAGAVMLQTLPQTSTYGRAVGTWLLVCIPAAYAILLSLIASNVAGTTKKLTTTMLTFVLFCVGNIVGPQLFKSNEAPVYGTALRSILVALVLCELLTLALGVYYILENKRRDKVLAETPAEVLASLTGEHEEFLDRTDMEDALKFRYRW